MPIVKVSSDANVQLHLVKLLWRDGRYRDSRELALQVAAKPTLTAELAISAAQLLRRFEESEALLDVLARTDWLGSSVQILTEAARLASVSGGYPLALDLLDRADSVDRSYPHACYMRGTILTFSGQTEAARYEFERALLLQPNQAHVHWMLSLLKTRDGTNAIDNVRQALSVTPSGTEAEAYLAYALHNYLHEAGQFDEAWEALVRGCRAKRNQVSYQAETTRELFDLLERVSIPRVAHAPTRDGPGLIFIVGMHRSGTTLLERMLAGHSAVADGGETYAFPAQMRQATDHCGSAVIDTTIVRRSSRIDFHEVARGYSRYARWRATGRSWLTEKLPTNFLNIGFILQAFPNARILHMVRDPMDLCFSNLRTFFGGVAGYSYDQVDLADYYFRYRGLMSHWREAAPGQILDIDYAAFVQNPESEIRRVLAFCGLPYESNVLDVGRMNGLIATASTADVRAGIRNDRSGIWKSYENHLRPLVNALRPAYA